MTAVPGTLPDRPSAAPYPYVSRQDNPRLHRRNTAYMIGLQLVSLPVLLMIAIATYFIGTQWWAPVKRAWHALVPNDSIRHLFRYLMEGYYAGLGQQLVVYNPFRRRQPGKWRARVEKALKLRELINWWDGVEMRLGIPNIKDKHPLSGKQFLLAVLFIGPIYAVPGGWVAFRVAIWMDHQRWFHDAMMYLSQHLPFGSTLATWPYIFVGFMAQRLGGRRVPRAVFADVHDRLAEWLVERHTRTGQEPPRWLPPNVLANYNWLRSEYHKDATIFPPRPQQRRMMWLIVGFGVIGFALFSYGVCLKIFVIP